MPLPCSVAPSGIEPNLIELRNQAVTEITEFCNDLPHLCICDVEAENSTLKGKNNP